MTVKEHNGDNLIHSEPFYFVNKRLDEHIRLTEKNLDEAKDILRSEDLHLKELLKGEIKALTDSVNQGNISYEKASLLADKLFDAHLTSMNGLQQLLKDQNAANDKKFEKYVSMDKHDVYVITTDKTLHDIQLWKAGLETSIKEKASAEDIKRIQNNYKVQFLLTIGGIIIAILIAYFK